MRQPMLRWRMLRHGAHHVNRRSLSGSSARPTSTRCSPSSCSNSSRSSGRWPMTPGLRSRGCTSISVRVMLMSPHRTSSRPSACSCFAHAASRCQELELRRIVLAAVRHVDRSEHEVAERGLHDARFHVEIGMAERRLGIEQALPDVQRHARVGAQAVPVDVIVRELAALGDLRGLRLQLLQAHDVGPVALQPLAELRLARADAVDVPGGNFHIAANRNSDDRRRPATASKGVLHTGTMLLGGRAPDW